MKIDLRLGDCIEVLKTLEENSVDSVVIDPPYGLGFMNKEWDSPEKLRQLTQREADRSADRKADGKSPTDAPFSKSVPPGLAIKGAKEAKWFQDWCYEWAVELLRVLKPGGHIVSFSAPRTYHRMATAFEDAGFEIRDQLMWLFGSGFPKSHNIGKALDKLGIDNDLHYMGTALKPSHEPIVLGRKPITENSIAENVLKYGTGGINIDGSRIEMKDKDSINFDRPRVREKKEWIYDLGIKWEDPNVKEYNENGRWPANIMLDEEAGQLLDEQSGYSKSKPTKGHRRKGNTVGDERTPKAAGLYGDGNWIEGSKHNDEGGASRFFYCAKTSKKDRNEGLDDFDEKTKAGAEFRPNHFEKSLTGDTGNPYGRWNKIKNNHPTVKPTELMSYLIKLITPKGGVVLDCFMGSGSTGKAAVREGFSFIGIEKEQEYMDIAKARIEHEKNKPRQPKLFNE